MNEQLTRAEFDVVSQLILCVVLEDVAPVFRQIVVCRIIERKQGH